jgi:hypothetical protein
MCPGNSKFQLTARSIQKVLPLILAFLGGVLLAVDPVSTASAADIYLTGASEVDQSVLVPPFQASIAVTDSQGWGQTFTVGLPGLLTRIDLQLGRNADTSLPLQVEICRTSGGLPDMSPQALLYSTSIAASAVPVQTWSDSFSVSVDLSSALIQVTPGDQLAVLLTTADGNWYNWTTHYWPDDIYPAGTAVKLAYPSAPNWIQVTGYDSGFQTWVTAVPESSTLLPLAFLILAAHHRFRRKI